jgi:hypothetical protein
MFNLKDHYPELKMHQVQKFDLITLPVLNYNNPEEIDG